MDTTRGRYLSTVEAIQMVRLLNDAHEQVQADVHRATPGTYGEELLLRLRNQLATVRDRLAWHIEAAYPGLNVDSELTWRRRHGGWSQLVTDINDCEVDGVEYVPMRFCQECGGFEPCEMEDVNLDVWLCGTCEAKACA